MSPLRPAAALCALLLASCGSATVETPRLALEPGTTIHYEQTFELTLDSVDGQEQNDLRVVQTVALSVDRKRPDDSYDLDVGVGRVRVWVGELSGPPAVDSLEHGSETADRIYESDDTGVAALLGALWLPMVETSAPVRVDARGRVLHSTEDTAVAERLDGNAAEEVGTVLLESSLRNPALLFAPVAGPAPVAERAPAIDFDLAPWGVSLRIPVVVEASAAGLTVRGSPPVPADVGPLRVDKATLRGTTRVGGDGLPDDATWTFEIVVWVPADAAGGDRVAQAATLRYRQQRMSAESE